MADEHQRIALLGELHRFNVDFGDQRAGSVNHFEPAALAALAHCRRHTVCGVDDALPIGNVVDLVDKYRAFLGQFVHHIAVVHDFAANVDGCAESLESDLHNVDSAHHTGAKAARLEQQNPFLAGGSSVGGAVRDGFEQSRDHMTSIST